MAWIAEYRTEFTDDLAKDWKVEIESVDFAGDVTIMQAEEPTLNIQFLATSDDFFDGPIKGSIAELTIRADTNFQYAALCSFADMQYRMSIYYDTTLYWRGYVTSENYSEPYDTIPYQVTITATDGLGMLKDYIYKYPDDTYYNGRRLESQIIIDILSKIGIPAVALDPIFTEYVNIYEESMADGAGDSPMDQLMIDVDVFKDMYCYDVLCEILKKYNACIRTYLGAYIIYRPVELSQAIVYGRIFTAATAKTPTSITPEQYISRTTHPTDLDDYNGGTLMIQKPAKKVTITQDYGNKESWLDNWEVKGNTWNGITFTSWNNPGGGINQLSQWIPSEPDGLALPVEETPYIWNVNQIFGTYTLASDDVLVFEFDYLHYNPTGSTVNDVLLHIILTDSVGNTHYLYLKDEEYVDWHHYFDEIYITENVPKGSTGWKTISRKVYGGVPVSGTYTLALHGSVSPNSNAIVTGFKNVRLYATSDELNVKKRKHKGPFPRLARWILKVSKYLKEYIDIIEVVERDYVKTNPINGNELQGNCILGDVTDTVISNVVEQFAGSLAIMSTLASAALDFVTDHAADYIAGGVIVTSLTVDIIFTSTIAGVNFTGSTTITNATGNLAGTVVNITPNNIGQVEIDTITLIGSSGTADITCGGITEEAVWDTNLTTTAHNFVEDAEHILNYGTIGISLSHSGADVIFTEQIALGGFTETSISNTSGSLNGTVVDTQEPIAATKRVDTITLTGTTGTANILCDAITRGVDIDASILTYTTDWNTRLPGSENKELLSIICDEIAKQYLRPKQFLSLPIREGNIESNDPHVDLLGNFKDNLNIDGSAFNIRTIAGWTKSNCTLTLSGNYTRYTSTSTDSNINKDGFSIVGSTDKTICIRYKIISGTPGYGQIFYTTTGHGRSSSYYKLFTTLTDGEWHLLYLDMSDLTAGGTDWIDNIITKIWIDLVENNTVVVDLDYIGFDRIFVFNKGQFNVRDREWNIDLIEII